MLDLEHLSRTRWDNLLLWLANHGMQVSHEHLLVGRKPRLGAGYGLFALDDCPRSTPLFTIPASAMINIRTLLPHHPRSALTATQLISMHLFLHRPDQELECLDPLFGPYISILPRDFNGHPLTWLVQQETIRDPEAVGFKLLQYFPPSATEALKKLGSRFWTDWKAVREYLRTNIAVLNKSTRRELTSVRLHDDEATLTLDFVWAWLNVNTRCIYHRLENSRSDPSNLTLCPILDFANHTLVLPHMLPAPADAEIWNTAPRHKLGDNFTLLSPADSITEAGEELYLTYGLHANRTLFVEYGFVNEIPAIFPDEGQYTREVDVQDIIERLFEDRKVVGAWMKGILENEGYWGNWTLDSSPTPAHPSYRLITALRLYHILPAFTSSIPMKEAEALQPWRDTLLGRREYVSEQNEFSWRKTLRIICVTLVERATTSLPATQTRFEAGNGAGWVHQMQENIRMLWEEERYVAAAVAQSIQDGEQF